MTVLAHLFVSFGFLYQSFDDVCHFFYDSSLSFQCSLVIKPRLGFSYNKGLAVALKINKG